MGEWMNRCADAMTNTDRSMDGRYSSPRWINKPSSFLISHWSHSPPDLLACWTSQKITDSHQMFILDMTRQSFTVRLVTVSDKGNVRLHAAWDLGFAYVILTRKRAVFTRSHYLKWCSIRQSLYVIHSSRRVFVFKLIFVFLNYMFYLSFCIFVWFFKCFCLIYTLHTVCIMYSFK